MQEQKKCVRFGKVTYIKEEVYFLDDMQRKQLWFTEEERKAMHWRLVQLMKDEMVCEEEEETMRGLELMSNEFQQKAVRAMHLLLLDLQEENRDAGLPDSQGLKVLSQRLTRHDVAAAVLTATEDAVAANRIYKETMPATTVDPCFL